MPKQKPAAKTRSLALRAGLSVVLLAAAGWVLARHWETVHRSLQLARGASIGWLVVSVILLAATFVVAAAIYGVLAVHGLRYRQTVLVEIASAFVNKILPSGIGGLGLHGLYLYRRKHTPAEATVVVSANNLLGMAAHLLLLGLALVFQPALLHEFTDGRRTVAWWFLGAVVLVVCAAWAVPPVRSRVRSFVRNLTASVRKIRPAQIGKALLLAALLTVTYTSILYSVSRALGIDLGALQIFIVFSVGMLTQTATPTPGGLVGAEAGLFAGFAAYGVAAAPAGAAVLVYRLVTYWLPLLPGAAALLLARRRRLV